MHYNQSENLFLFEKDTEFIEILKNKVKNGVIKEYPDVYSLEPLPEILHKNDYDIILIDGNVIPWEKLSLYTKDRLKATVENKATGDDETIKIENFYDRRYNPDEIEEIFKHYTESSSNPYWLYKSSFCKNVLGFQWINLRAD